MPRDPRRGETPRAGRLEVLPTNFRSPSVNVGNLDMATIGAVLTAAAGQTTIDPGTFSCPRCQSTGRHQTEAPLAYVVNPLLWGCHRCAGGTLFGLRRIVLEDALLLAVLLDGPDE